LLQYPESFNCRIRDIRGKRIMSEETSSLFSVLAAEERLPDFALTVKILSEFCRLNSNDAGHIARHCWGFMGENLSPAAAASLAEKCGTYGVKTITLPSVKMARREAPVLIKKADLGTGAFSYTGGAGLGANANFSDILVLSAAPIKEETAKIVKSVESPSSGEKALRLGIMAATGLPIGIGKSKEVKKEVKTSETAFRLDIILKQANTRLRLNPAAFDFSCLKEKKTYSSQMNFKVMCAELAALAPKALKNTGLWAIIEHKPLGAAAYDGMEDFEKETSRLNMLALERTNG